MAMVKLNRPACEAIQREARFQLENSIGEYSGPPAAHDDAYRQQHRNTPLLCADLIGLLDRVAQPGEESLIEVDLPAHVLPMLKWMRVQMLGAIDDQERGRDIADYETACQDVFLVYVLDRVLGHDLRVEVA